MKVYKGFTASPGLVLGQVSRLDRPPLVFDEGPFHPEQEKQALEEAIKVLLRLARATDDPSSPEAAELAAMHRKWITVHWGPGFDTATYLALAHGYLADPRFTKYYDDAAGVGATEFLVQAVEAANT